KKVDVKQNKLSFQRKKVDALSKLEARLRKKASSAADKAEQAEEITLAEQKKAEGVQKKLDVQKPKKKPLATKTVTNTKRIRAKQAEEARRPQLEATRKMAKRKTMGNKEGETSKVMKFGAKETPAGDRSSEKKPAAPKAPPEEDGGEKPVMDHNHM
ncbi:MAG: hypothetical protein HQ561_04445, partial [Desulfobacteraceae bacterium]|nr:hypothetical protein [Desulfobacteraceae bacterium]